MEPSSKAGVSRKTINGLPAGSKLKKDRIVSHKAHIRCILFAVLLLAAGPSFAQAGGGGGGGGGAGASAAGAAGGASSPSTSSGLSQRSASPTTGMTSSGTPTTAAPT